MLPYNVEIWSTDFEIKEHFQIDKPDYKEDYLSYEKNSINVISTTAKEGDYIRIYPLTINGYSYTGIITEIVIKKKITTITYIDFMSLTDVSVVVDWTAAAQTDVESFISDFLTETYVSNLDAMQNIAGFTIITSTSTVGSIDPTEKQICNLYKDIILPAFYDFGIRLTFNLDVGNKKIIAMTDKLVTEKKYIETDLPNISEKNIIIKQTNNAINKAIIYSEDMTQSAVFYRFDDNGNRITPVNYTIETVNTTPDQTFATAAQIKADSIFNKSSNQNLIEITCKTNDTLVGPSNLKIGQEVIIISSGKQYTSIFTGRKTKDEATTLTFGTIRLELTKKIK